RYLQPWLHALLSPDRRSAVPGNKPLRPAPGSPLDGREAAQLRAPRGSDGTGSTGCQDDGQGAGASVPDSVRGLPGPHPVLQEGPAPPPEPGAFPGRDSGAATKGPSRQADLDRTSI